ncbi:MAG: prepilin-type N-terminal cleavage/methylation domain-containing protein [Pseudomonadota bacterium]
MQNAKQHNIDFKKKILARPEEKIDVPGFTLLEVLIAMVVLAVGLLSIAALQSAVVSGNDVSDEVAQAMRLAEADLAHFTSLSMEDIDKEIIYIGGDKPNWDTNTFDFPDLNKLNDPEVNWFKDAETPNMSNDDIKNILLSSLWDGNELKNWVGVDYHLARYIEKDAPDENMIMVVSAVRWRGSDKMAHQVVCSTTIAKPIL